MKPIRKIVFSTLIFLAVAVHADEKISQLPLGNASTTGVNDSFPYVDSVAGVTRRLKLSDSINIPAFVSTYAPLTSPVFTGVVQTPHLKLTTTPTNGYVLTSDAFGNAAWVAPAASGSGAAGSGGAIQFNNAGVLAANSALFWDNIASTLNSPLFIGNLTGVASGNELPLTFSPPLSRTVNTISIPVATSSVNGYLKSTDWTTFNGKQSALTFGSISTSTSGVTVGSGSNSTVGPNVTVDVQTASASQPGLLISADWTNFNGKQASGNYITALTSDVTASGPGSVAATIASNAVTNAKAAQMAAHTIKGNNTGSTANALDLTDTQVTAELNNFVGDSGAGGTKGLVPAPSAGDTAAGKVLSANGSWAAVTSGINQLTSDVTAGPGTGSQAATIAAHAVTNSKMAQMVGHTYKGNNTGSTADPIDVTSTQLTADLNLFTSSLQGLVPGSGGGTTNFLRADGSWATAGAGSVSSVALSDGSSSPIYTISGTPVTSSGTLTETLSTQAKNIIFAGPASGSNAQPTFRALVSADIPALSTYLTVANNLSDVSSKPSAFSNVSPLTTLGDTLYEDASPAGVRLAGNTTTTKKYLNQTGTGSISAAPAWSQPAFSELSGNATVSQGGTGLTSDTAYAVVTGGTTSTAALQQVSGLGTSNNTLISNGSGTLPTWGTIALGSTTAVSGTLPVANGGTGLASTTTYGIIFGGTTSTAALQQLGVGTSGQLLQSAGAGALPTWNTPTSIGPISATYYASSNLAPGANTILNLDTKVTDTNSAVTTGSSWKFTAPVTGNYHICFVGHPNTATAWDLYFEINGTNKGYLFSVRNQGDSSSGCTTWPMTAADTLDFKMDTAGSTQGGALPGLTYASIDLVPGIPTGVAARYYSSTTTISGTLATITYATKDFDTANMCSSGVCTVPTGGAGKYQINAGLLITGTFALNSTTVLEIQKNNSVITRNKTFAGGIITDSTAQASDAVNLADGDTIRIQASTSATVPSIVSDNFANYFSMVRME